MGGWGSQTLTPSLQHHLAYRPTPPTDPLQGHPPEQSLIGGVRGWGWGVRGRGVGVGVVEEKNSGNEYIDFFPLQAGDDYILRARKLPGVIFLSAAQCVQGCHDQAPQAASRRTCNQQQHHLHGRTVRAGLPRSGSTSCFTPHVQSTTTPSPRPHSACRAATIRLHKLLHLSLIHISEPTRLA